MFNRRSDRRPATDARYERLSRYLHDAQTFNGVDPAGVRGMHSRVRDDERVFLCVQGASLITAPPPSAPTPRPIDHGELVITNTRALFTGTKQIRQWGWAQLVDIEHADNGSWTSIFVSDRSRAFGVLYDKGAQDEIRFNIELAVAVAQGKRDELIHVLTDQLRAAEAEIAQLPDASLSA